MLHDRALWIDWGSHLRTHSLCSRLGVSLLEIRHGGPRLVRYFKSSLATFKAIRQQNPETVIATNPSIVLGYLLLFLRPFFGFKLVSDAHYAGVILTGRGIIQRILDFHNRSVDLVIVTTNGHKLMLEDVGADTFVCPDPLPELPTAGQVGGPTHEKQAFLICSFARDEPFGVVFEAFRELQSEGFSVQVSGRYQKTAINPAHFPWVEFLGFIPDGEYLSRLASSSVVIDLTTNENCLVCGAYEAMALGKPLILSRTRANQEYFGSACVMTDVEVGAVRDAVRAAYERKDELGRSVGEWVARNEKFMEERVRALRSQILENPDRGGSDQIRSR